MVLVVLRVDGNDVVVMVVVDVMGVVRIVLTGVIDCVRVRVVEVDFGKSGGLAGGINVTEKSFVERM